MAFMLSEAIDRRIAKYQVGGWYDIPTNWTTPQAGWLSVRWVSAGGGGNDIDINLNGVNFRGYHQGGDWGGCFTIFVPSGVNITVGASRGLQHCRFKNAQY